MTGISRDEAIIDKLEWALDHLGDAQTMMDGHTVSSGAWPEVGRLLSEIEYTIKQIELAASGRMP